ncbi:MAG TPA: hypothetical protein VEO92_05185, partial [Candidatus Nitrosocosmicus sp.]|nr:hypothetical protein [Candidatus Nitrosocosmicus sp.]
MTVAKLTDRRKKAMRKINILLSTSLIVALMNIPIASAQDDRRDDRRYDRRDDRRDDRPSNWWDGILNGNTASS